MKVKKSWFRRHPFLTGLGVLIILIIIIPGSKKKDSTTNTASTQAETAVSQKSYQQVFTFSGSGAKKSEPFMISGDRFKIKYDCKGDPSATLCTAFVLKVGSSLPQAVMNSTQATKDETVIYTNMAGKGEYYIDANVLGNFTMTVEDYK
ncbi:MAG: hypothetical protein V4665_03625 [Patescibacteria group bacterium]